MKRFTLFLMIAICAALSTTFAATAQAQEARAYLVFATNGGEGSSPELREFDQSLRQLFGFKHYRLVATSAAQLRGNEPVALPLDRGMVMHVTSLGVDRNVRSLDVTVKQGQTTLVTSKMRMAGGAPLFIRGHERTDGLLVMVLVVR